MMTKLKQPTKQIIIDAAIELFNTNGYRGTTIRDIAKRANVNIANISYYFSGKQGLLEACVTDFFETYLLIYENGTNLHDVVYDVLAFQSSCPKLTRFVWREMTLDSQLSREVISYYLMKERYYLRRLVADEFLIIQLKSLLMMPYLNSQYVMKVWGIHPHDPYFLRKYSELVHKWLEQQLVFQ